MQVKKNTLKRLLSLALGLVMLLGLLPGAALAVGEGWFYFSASTDGLTVVAPEKISYQPGDTIRQALMSSGHTFAGIEDNWVNAIDGVNGNFIRTDENGGYDMDRPAAEIGYFCFSEKESFLGAGRMALISAMADYLDEEADVRAAAKSKYDAALSDFAGADDTGAQRLAKALTDAIEAYKNAQGGERFTVSFTDGAAAYTPENYPGVVITAVSAFGKSYEDDDGDGALSLVAGEYTFSVVQDYNRIDGSADKTVSAVLPSGDWMMDNARVSLAAGASFEDSELEVTRGDHTLRVTVPDNYASGSYYLLAYYNKDIFSQTPKLFAYYTRVDGIVIAPRPTTTAQTGRGIPSSQASAACSPPVRRAGRSSTASRRQTAAATRFLRNTPCIWTVSLRSPGFTSMIRAA